MSSSPAVPASHAEEIEIAGLRAAFANLVPVASVSIVTGTVCFAFAWSRGPTAYLPFWLAALWTAAIARFVLGRRFHARTRSDAEVRRFLPIYSAGMISGGFLWGALVAATGFTTDPFVLIVILLNIAGMIAGGTATVMTTPRTFAAMNVLSLVPIELHLVLTGERSFQIIAGFVCFFLLHMGGTTLANRRAFHELQSLRYANLDLVEGLTVANERAESARERAELADLAKSRFLAAASHDVRQPLHALGLFIESLRSESLPTRARALLDRITLSSDAIKSLLESLLDVSRLDAGVLVPRPRPFHASALLRTLEAEAAPRAAERGLRLVVRPSELALFGDPDLLLRMARNLVANAIEHSERGGVLVAFRRRGEHARFEVWDTGPGIPEHEQALIFEEFRQLGNESRDRSNGLGLGLAIVRRLASLVGTEVTLRSRVGRGSVFRFDVPLADPGVVVDRRLSSAPPEARANANGEIVLVVDDDALARDALASLLSTWGFEVVVARDADEAREYVAALDSLDAVVSDFRLPGASGLELLRELAAARPEARAILVTGDTDPAIVRAVHASGFPILHKPVDAAGLAKLLGARASSSVAS